LQAVPTQLFAGVGRNFRAVTRTQLASMQPMGFSRSDVGNSPKETFTV